MEKIKLKMNLIELLPLFKNLSSLYRKLVLILIFIIFHGLTLSAQIPLLNLHMKNVSLHEILMEIKKQSGKNIIYNNNLTENYINETVELKNSKLDEALKKVLEGKNLNYRITDNVIIIEPVTEKPHSNIPKELFQNIKGTVFDIESNSPLVGATIVILETSPIKGTTSDLEGNYKLEEVPIGRYNIQVSYVGYESVKVSEVLVTTGKEVVINIGLKQVITQMSEVMVKAYTQKDKPLNSMASLSARSFTVEESRRYAGGLDDPARLASSFAGVTMSSISDNGIVIRGNSAKGVSWRLEGVDIPNPNHFAGQDVVGGGIVTVFSSQMLANSDFFTGAFPAEYNNALAGVFDMKFRNGNNNKREYTFQAGLLGIDISSEGPFKKGRKATYLFNYRYSTFGLMKIFIPANSGLPDYQDLSFKLNFPNNNGSISVWGIGAIDSWQKPKTSDSTKWETPYDRTSFNWDLSMGAMGITHKLFLNDKTYISSTLVGTGTVNNMDEKRYDNNMILRPNSLLKDNSNKIVLSSFVNHKFNKWSTLKTGFNYTTLFYNLNLNSTINDDPGTFRNSVNEKGTSNFFEYYAQSKIDITNNLALFPGINTMYFTLNNDFSIDPRLSIKWEFHSGQSLSFGFGKHSQLEELKIYLVTKIANDKIEFPNKNLLISHSIHYVFGYDWRINDYLRLKIEPYYQYLYNIPGIPGTSYSMINYTQDWALRNSLANNCYGQNYGIDATLERFLHDGYYYLITASIFNSKYKADDGVWRDTRFNKGFAANLLFGKEFNIRNNKVLGINSRLNLMGGDRFSPVDEEKSTQEKTVVFNDTKAFSVQMPVTKYVDLTITYRNNKQRYSSIWALQVKNILAAPMYREYAYYYEEGKAENKGIVVILPVLSYKIEF